MLLYCFLSFIETVARKERKLPAVVAVNVPPSCSVFMKEMTSPSLARKSGAILKTIVRLSTAETSNAERQLAVCRLPVSFADLSV